jgi:hypothetical protein
MRHDIGTPVRGLIDDRADFLDGVFCGVERIVRAGEPGTSRNLYLRRAAAKNLPRGLDHLGHAVGGVGPTEVRHLVRNAGEIGREPLFCQTQTFTVSPPENSPPDSRSLNPVHRFHQAWADEENCPENSGGAPSAVWRFVNGPPSEYFHDLGP